MDCQRGRDWRFFKIGWTYRWRLDFFIAPVAFAERSEALSGCLLCFHCVERSEKLG